MDLDLSFDNFVSENFNVDKLFDERLEKIKKILEDMNKYKEDYYYVTLSKFKEIYRENLPTHVIEQGIDINDTRGGFGWEETKIHKKIHDFAEYKFKTVYPMDKIFIKFNDLIDRIKDEIKFSWTGNEMKYHPYVLNNVKLMRNLCISMKLYRETKNDIYLREIEKIKKIVNSSEYKLDVSKVFKFIFKYLVDGVGSDLDEILHLNYDKDLKEIKNIYDLTKIVIESVSLYKIGERTFTNSQGYIYIYDKPSNSYTLSSSKYIDRDVQYQICYNDTSNDIRYSHYRDNY